MRINIRVVQATAEPSTIAAYIDGHLKVLEAYGVTKVTSASTDWKDDPSTYIIVAESEDGERVHGGGRIQIKSLNGKMPLEDAIAILDPRIYPYAEALGNDHTAEFCGLWNSKEIAGYGVGSIFLGEVGVAVCPQLGVQHLMALCSPATLSNCMKVGFQIIRELGNNGTLYYPKEDLIATALIIHDIDELPTANPATRERIKLLRAEPNQEVSVAGPKGDLNIVFQLAMTANISA